MKKKLLALLVLLTFMIAIPVEAKEINDFYATSDDNIKLQDTVNGDSAIAGNIIDMAGNIDGIGFIAGQTINIKGNLEYGFIAGQNITINGNITKNIYAAGQTITFTKYASIGRDIFLAADTITLNGNLERNINISASKVIIENGTTINGNINIDTSEIIIKDNVKIEGTLKYNNTAKETISKNAQIAKTQTYKTTDNNQINTTEILQSILNMVVVFLCITILVPQTIDKTEKIYNNKKTNYLKNIGIGFLLLICIPLISILLLVSNIGVYLGLIIAGLYLIALYISFIISGFILGNLLLKKLMNLNTNKYLSGIIGIILLKLLMLIPVLGTILGLIALTLGLSTIWNLVQKDDNNQKAIEKQEETPKKDTKKETIVEAKVENKKPRTNKTQSSKTKTNTKKTNKEK